VGSRPASSEGSAILSRIADAVRKARQEEAARKTDPSGFDAGDRQPLRDIAEVNVPWALKEPQHPVSGDQDAVSIPSQQPLERARPATPVERLTAAPAADDEIVALVRRLFPAGARDTSNRRRVLFTEVDDQGGSTEIARQVAEALAARPDRSVCLADLDLEHPSVHRHYAVDGRPGFAEAVRGDVAPHQCAHRLKSRPNLMVMPAGLRPVGVTPTSNRRQRSSEIVSLFDYFIAHIGASAVAVQSEASDFIASFDGVVLVVDAGRTSPVQLRKTAKALEIAGLHLLGTVLRQAHHRR
jgi:Mrp family chromosome partitioning ATPase